MVEKPYNWPAGAKLLDHTARKHKIIRAYFAKYLAVRCSHPQQSVFRLAIVDGFAGAGRYKDGEPGSPLIFVEELRAAAFVQSVRRRELGLKGFRIECLLILNDFNKDTLEQLRTNIDPLLAETRESCTDLAITTMFFNQKFEPLYPSVKSEIERYGIRNVLFNLDQCGHIGVSLDTIRDIVTTYQSAEVFYTFACQSLISFLPKTDRELLKRYTEHLGFDEAGLSALGNSSTNQQWLGAAEKLTYNTLERVAPYFSPFSINNPTGWTYWLIHFANSYRAREVYNVILHENSTLQAHFGRSGLNMLHYDPRDADGTLLYLFDEAGRSSSREQLMDDIPRVISGHGDALDVASFKAEVYKATPAHKDDIHEAIIANPDLEVITPKGGIRRVANSINLGDTIRLKRQRSFHSIMQNTSFTNSPT